MPLKYAVHKYVRTQRYKGDMPGRQLFQGPKQQNPCVVHGFLRVRVSSQRMRAVTPSLLWAAVRETMDAEVRTFLILVLGDAYSQG